MRVTIAPSFEVRDDLLYVYFGTDTRGQARTKAVITEKRNPPGLAALDWGIALGVFDYYDAGPLDAYVASQPISDVKATFDTGPAVLAPTGYGFQIPDDARRLVRVEAIWKGVGHEVPLSFTIVDDRPPAKVRVDGVADCSIQLTDRPVKLAARTEPPGREAEVRWRVDAQQSATARRGTGAEFTTSWTEPGVKQVVAMLGDQADDLLIYVFKTKTGGSSLADILDSEPPKALRGPESYKWFRAHEIPSDEDAEDAGTAAP